MKKIINGKAYDTATAKSVGYWTNGGTWRDFGHVEETLYRKKTGEFFLHGEGGPASRYAKPSGQNSWSSGERIMPMTFQEARAWAEEHLDGEDYEEAFGAVVEDDSRRTVTLSLSVSAVETIRRRAAEAGMTISAYVESLIK